MIELTLIHRRPVTRWADIIEAMHELDFSERDIAAALGVPRDTLRRWKRGSCPNFEDGQALLDLFETLRPHLTRAVIISGLGATAPHR
ncbi:MAG: hypothetical protein PVS3B2_00170 [Candidatus Dormibacteraceae bacterium]